MYHGMNPSSGDLFLEKQQQSPGPRRLLVVVLWLQLALCFGPAQITGVWLPQLTSKTDSTFLFNLEYVTESVTEIPFIFLGAGSDRMCCLKKLHRQTVNLIFPGLGAVEEDLELHKNAWAPDPLYLRSASCRGTLSLKLRSPVLSWNTLNLNMD